MRYTLLLLLLCPLFVLSQEAKSKVSVNTVKNSVRMGPMTGNLNLTMGVKNIIQEVLQDKGYSLVNKDEADLFVDVEIVYMDQQKTATNISIFHKDENTVVIRMLGKLINKSGKVVKKELVTDESSEISTSTLLISENGEFNSTVMRNALKKTCVQVVNKLL
jgi:uncharacterized lipoprotein YajG